MTFLTTPRFPTGIAYGSGGGPRFDTTIVPLRSGRTVKNANWAYPLQVFNVLTGIQSQVELQSVRDLFYAMKGQFNTFRFLDKFDWKSCVLEDSIASDDQILGTGDGANRTFLLQKTYTFGALDLIRPIPGALATSLTVEVAGATSASYTHVAWSGEIVFATGSIPATGEVVKAGFDFDVICEFATDEFNVTAENCDSGRGAGLLFNVDVLPIREVRMV